MFVLWISSFAAQAAYDKGAIIAPSGWGLVSTPPNSGVTIKPDFSTTFPANSEWFGGISTGYPICFVDAAQMARFINALLNNVGTQVNYPARGISADSVIRRHVQLAEEQYFYPEPNNVDTYDTEMTQIRLIGPQDILRIQVLPRVFQATQATPKFFTVNVNLPDNLSNFNPIIDERTVVLPDGSIHNDYSKSKLMLYPYWFFELKTATGDSIVITPQNHMSIGNFLNDHIIRLVFKLTGGDRPCLQVAVTDSALLDDGATENQERSTLQWYTIYEFPTLSWSSDVSTEQQLAAIQAITNRRGEMQAAIIGNMTKGFGIEYGIRGGQADFKRQGLDALGTMLGGIYRNIDPKGQVKDTQTDTQGGRYKFSDQLLSQLGKSEAGRIIQTSNFISGGGDSLSILSMQAIAFFRRGYNWGELFGFGRFLEREGQSCHLNGNPITNSFNIFGGNASITSYGGKTYYLFSDIDVMGTMPVDFKNAIAIMFCGGCYLMG